MTFFLFAAGIILLFAGGELLVRGAGRAMLQPPSGQKGKGLQPLRAAGLYA